MVVVFDVYFCVWFCTHRTMKLFDSLWSFVYVTMLRADTLSYYHSICRHIQSKTVSEHNAGCELYSSHIETKMLAMNVTVK